MQLDLYTDVSGNGEPLLLLHGLFGSGKNLNILMRSLLNRYRVFTPDLRSHGRSPHSDHMDYPAMADDLFYLIEKQALKNIILVGHSMGGKVAMTAALTEPALFKCMVVLDIAPVDYTHSFSKIISALQSVKLDQVRSRQDADMALAGSIEETSLRQFLLQNLVNENGGYQWRIDLHAIENNISRIMSFPDFSDKTFTKPVLFLGGMRSHYMSDKYDSKIHQYFPNATIRRIQGAGHWLHAEAPEKTIMTIETFLDQ